MVEPVFSDPDGTREQILAATYRVLCDQGYANLTISAIGEEFEKSPSLVYQHYDSKDDLVLECLEFLLDHFEGKLKHDGIDDPSDQLEEVLDWWFTPAVDDKRMAFVSAMFELRIQAIHDPAFQEHFTRSDRLFGESIATGIRAGIDAGDFPECDPDAVAETIQSTIIGAGLRRSSTDSDEWLGQVHDELEKYLQIRVCAERDGDFEE
ncbi:TetR/AcrR family transcriptional regulator [Natrinema thermotolerans]|uniref:TetR/AcrR family transcriptional regulator n=1 Tax=Natrinema thermotolerans TaxID=121872 RepID=A0AAF0P7Q0_9EURY|nr:TetR/AcrR family transcriptional regulator [Natrinema thermotolerans]QCC59897.1 TetR/AcrR family transcriptional regulator [Natrinema thermotolerans]WMT06893.1 TetR/AcrR family transcriptional regulator [Natrinema thermotolerans]